METREPDPAADRDGDTPTFVAPCMTLTRSAGSRGGHTLRAKFGVQDWFARPGAPCRRMPYNFQRWEVVKQYMQLLWTASSLHIAGLGPQAMLCLLHGQASRPAARPCRGLVLLPVAWVEQRPSVWTACFRWLTEDYQHLSGILITWHIFAFVCLPLCRQPASRGVLHNIREAVAFESSRSRYPGRRTAPSLSVPCARSASPTDRDLKDTAIGGTCQ